jgi:hypothetical protein
MAGNTYKGLAPDTDPAYSKGWTITLRRNSNPSSDKGSTKPSPTGAPQPPRQPPSRHANLSPRRRSSVVALAEASMRGSATLIEGYEAGRRVLH